MNNISMFPHVGSGNHGCEAIVRSTAQLFSDHFLNLFSDNIQEDKKYINDDIVKYFCATAEISRFSPSHFKALYYRYLKKMPDAFSFVTYNPLLRMCKSNDILMSIGGDLYCYDTPDYIYRVNKYVRAQGCKTVLWGCSVEPSYIDDKMAADLKGYDLICARESITYEALKKINQNTILTVDPAFALVPEECELPAKSYIGMNVSPMIEQRESVKGITIENYVQLIKHILEVCDDSVALIPHVVWSTNDDRSSLARLKQYFEDYDRVVVVDDHNCAQLKYIIKNCRMYIGARTHSTIAAYSSCVPTLVVGYSVKAKGIAKDLFGSYDNYVIPVQGLKNKDDLSNAFDWMMANENEIKQHLQNCMPSYVQKLNAAVDAVMQLQGEK